MEDDETLMVDGVLLGKIEAFLKMIIGQIQSKMEGGGVKNFPESLEVYVKVALYEYRTFLSFYYDWESGEELGGEGEWPVGEGGRREFPKLMSFAAVKGYV